MPEKPNPENARMMVVLNSIDKSLKEQTKIKDVYMNAIQKLLEIDPIGNIIEKANVSGKLGATAKYAGAPFSTAGYTKLVGYAISDQNGRLEIHQSQLGLTNFIEDVVSEFDLDMAKVAIDNCQIYDDNAGTTTAETTDINDVGANDVPGAPITANKEDILYFGSYIRFGKLYITVGTAGDYTGSITWEYWDGLGWVNLATSHNLSDGTGNFKNAAGSYNVIWDIPNDISETSINGVTMYWIRARATCTALTTAPLLTQAWMYPLVEIPYSIDVIGKYAKLVYYNEGTAQTYFRAVCNLRREK